MSSLSTTPAASASSDSTQAEDADLIHQRHASGRSGNGEHSSQLLKEIPVDRELRETLRNFCQGLVGRLDRSSPLDQAGIETLAREALTAADASEGYIGWTMVTLLSEFWRDQVAATPYSRRLLVAPPCRHCAEVAGRVLSCQECGVAPLRVEAEALGYRVLVAEDAAGVMQGVAAGGVDAVVGFASLELLEKAINPVLLVGVPCMAAPLNPSSDNGPLVDPDWAGEMVRLSGQPTESNVSPSYASLVSVARRMFEPAELERLVPRRQETPAGGLPGSPIAETERIARDFLTRGGKYSRPYITLAAFTAASGFEGSPEALPCAVKSVALSIEAFHKASLVHDDIQDDDAHRYGAPTLHREHGVAAAINIGDYLIGLGYQLVAGDAAAISSPELGGAQAAADILHKLSACHIRLTEGQGAELVWRDRSDKTLSPADALAIYALKTSPAFEAALYGGIRLAGENADLSEPVHEFCKHLGVAFQILNDLKDWRGDNDNKLAAGGDVLGGRPTLLLALALEALNAEQSAELLRIAAAPSDDTLPRVRDLYEKASVFTAADEIIASHRRSAEAIAGRLPDALGRLAHYLIEWVLRGSEPAPATATGVSRVV